MKKVVGVFLAVLLLGACALAADESDKREEDRVKDAGEVMKEVLNIPDDIPQDLLDKAECVVILPSVKKGAFGVGASYGRGRDDLPWRAALYGKMGSPGTLCAGRCEHWIPVGRAGH